MSAATHPRACNAYGGPITPPDSFHGEHYATVPLGGGSPPFCSCGWTRFYDRGARDWVEMWEHLRDLAAEGRAVRV